MSDNQPGKKAQLLVRERAKECCEYCMALSNYAFHPFSIDHIFPISKGRYQPHRQSRLGMFSL